MKGKIDVNRLMKELSDILSEKYDLDIKITVRLKDEAVA